jgi:hypothetical protein
MQTQEIRKHFTGALRVKIFCIACDLFLYLDIKASSAFNGLTHFLLYCHTYK